MEKLSICANQKLSFWLKNCATQPFGGQALSEPDGRAYRAPHSPDSRPSGLKGRGKERDVKIEGSEKGGQGIVEGEERGMRR